MPRPATTALSPRQAEIAALIVRARSNGEIAESLSLSERTVENHVAEIFNKLGINSRVELVARLLGSGELGESPLPAGSTNHNLPAQRTSLVGRESAIDEIAASLAENRLVSVIGPGGIGKTRTALAVGALRLEDPAAQVWFVDLAPVANGTHVVTTIAQALNFNAPPKLPPLEALLAHVKAKRMLIVLDNCEHVIADAAAVANALLRNCSHVRILATSREPLRIAGEQIFRLPPLPVPSAGAARDLSAAEAAEYAAVVLFDQRARSSDRRFALGDDNAPTVAEICRQLDGIPLAIELAAARVHVLTLRALSRGLDRRLALLTSGDRTVLPRHQTMRALIDWSYDLLAPPERRLFERLSVFAGGCDLAAATAVAADDAEGELEVLTLLASLVDKSLVVADLSDDEPRYRLLESTRQYAREKLAARGETALVAHRHARAYLDLAQRFEHDYDVAPDSQRRATLFQVEVENLRAALEWCLDGRGDVILGQRLAAVMVPVWMHVSLVEGRHWLRVALELVDEETPPLVKARLEAAAAVVALSFGEWDDALLESRRLVEKFLELGDSLGVARARFVAGVTLVCLGRAAEGEPVLQLTLEAARAAGNLRLAGGALENIAYARSRLGYLADARARIAEALAIWQSIGADRDAADAAVVLGEAEFLAGNVERALELVAGALVQLRKLPATRTLTPALLNQAAYFIACDRFDEGLAAAREALGLAQETQRNSWPLWALQHLAAIAALSAGPAGGGSRSRVAAELLGYVDARVAALGSPREDTEQGEYDRVRAALLEALGDAEWARLTQAGAALTESQALELAYSI
jgi:predicted ATPase/DNA-binding CsgD family transcriptional regulator